MRGGRHAQVLHHATTFLPCQLSPPPLQAEISKQAEQLCKAETELTQVCSLAVAGYDDDVCQRADSGQGGSSCQLFWCCEQW